MPAPMTEAAKPPPHMTGCVCEQGGARFTEFESRDVGRDETEGRFADVTLNRCRTCGRTWLRYLVEYEAFSRSGRWARGLIGEEAAQSITPQAAVDHLNGLEWYLYGGSYFDGIVGRRSGPMRWGA
jgi:hypothetical protein